MMKQPEWDYDSIAAVPDELVVIKQHILLLSAFPPLFLTVLIYPQNGLTASTTNNASSDLRVQQATKKTE